MRIAVSGTYSSGKTTTTLALSHLTNMPRTHAKTMREILPEVLPGKRLEVCTMPELFRLAIHRYTERILHESKTGDSFVSDGSALHEWAYGSGRLVYGINPSDPTSAQMLDPFTQRIYGEFIYNLGCVVKQYAQESYDVFIHLPIEFPLCKDGHRPVSEKFRKMTDELLISTLDELAIKYYIVSGSIEERLKKIVEVLNLKTQMELVEAVKLAYSETSAMQKEIETYNNKILLDNLA
jgi:nicotinamide riboside kinase